MSGLLWMTGHAEAIQLSFDPAVISYHDLLELFFAFHDPTTLNRQGPDEGTQYRSAIFYHSPEQKAEAERVIRELEAAATFDSPIVTQLLPADTFYPAESASPGLLPNNPTRPTAGRRSPKSSQPANTLTGSYRAR
jgi:peptide-methionine (S)-S-oxide reductase